MPYSRSGQTQRHSDGIADIHNVFFELTGKIPTLASCSFDEMVDAAIPGQTQFMQLYVNADRSRTKKIVAHAADRGVKALFITVDAPQLGRREKVCRYTKKKAGRADD